MTKTSNRQALLTLHYIYPLPLQKLQLILNCIDDLNELPSMPTGHLSHVLNITLDNASKLKINFQKYCNVPFEEIFQERKIHIIAYNDPHYPQELFQLIDPPTILYAVGDISLLKRQKIAIIGSRNATEYTKVGLSFIVPPLVLNQYVIVSGLAKGADTMAHQTTIHLGGKTIGVLGSGFDHIYPRENKELFNEMKENHCVITEFPPYMGPKKWHFPLRNRIISGLSQALVVTEAAERSGTLITTEHALEHGKDIFIVPGPIDSTQSSGTNKLIKEGAIPVWNGYQIISELQIISI